MYSKPNNNGSLLSSRVLVLNKLYTVVKVTTARRAFTLLYKNSAEVITKNNGTFMTYNFPHWMEQSEITTNTDGDEFIYTPDRRLKLPRVIRLFIYDKLPRHEVKFSRKNILARDNYCCQYCGRRYSAIQLSVDHIIPRSSGGNSNWNNLVACCSKCNTKKGRRLPHEVGMKLIRKPAAPTMNPLLYDYLNDKKYSLWKEFITGKKKRFS